MNADIPPPYASPPGLWRRAAAWSVDFALVVALAVALGAWTWTRLGELLAKVPSMAEKSAWSLLTSGGDVKGASVDFGLSLWNSATGYVVQAFVALVLIVFVYHVAALAWKGRTVGKLVLDLRVEPYGRMRLGKGQALLRATATTISDIGLFALACCLLLEGLFMLSVACWVLAVAVFWLNVLPVLFPGRRTLQDRITGTHVARAHLYRAATSQAVQGGRLALQGAQQGAQRLVNHDRVQQLRSSDTAERVQGLGRDAADKGRQALSKAKRAYNEHRTSTPPAIPHPGPAQFPVQPPSVPYAQSQPPLPPIPRPEDQ